MPAEVFATAVDHVPANGHSKPKTNIAKAVDGRGTTNPEGRFPLPAKLRNDPRLVNGEYYGTNTLGCSDEEWRTRVDLAAAYRLCHKWGFVEGINNHLTAEIPGSNGTEFLVFPFGLSWSEVSASDLLVLSEHGDVLRGEGIPEATAFWIHSRIHKYRPGEAMAVLHTHQPWATALTTLENAHMPMIFQTALFFKDDLTYNPDFGGLVMTGDEGQKLAEMMGDRNTLFHANHGVIVVGNSVARAVLRLYHLEWASKVVVKALSTGRDVKLVSDEVARETARTLNIKGGQGDEFGRLSLEAWKRELLNEGKGDFAS